MMRWLIAILFFVAALAIFGCPKEEKRPVAPVPVAPVTRELPDLPQNLFGAVSGPRPGAGTPRPLSGRPALRTLLARCCPDRPARDAPSTDQPRKAHR